MQRRSAALGSSLFFLLAPGTVAGVIPGWLTHWWRTSASYGWPVRALGAVLLVLGASVLVHSFVRFVVEGLGTPAPIAPPSQLVVVGGLYRYVRNPMYVGILSAVAGQALLLGRPVLWAWFGVLAIAFGSFVQLYEQPKLARLFGEDYARYRREVPGWVPRLRRYRGDR